MHAMQYRQRPGVKRSSGPKRDKSQELRKLIAEFGEKVDGENSARAALAEIRRTLLDVSINKDERINIAQHIAAQALGA